ncbi:8-oxo-dGTP diphosphatase MutT [Rheinheimera tangshanensis]|jgi:8-oxo-dGTP diphosphatase|uniref:8-oxo-dGTP diphosphatase n=1 Tax=Rheinheimera tangshanensis TaxID=400153 RepID=A0A5C8LYI5_9GAMM|nr:8-oxo-dGTP diphosphatase MutT [Rheinheimera tangshanensis]TXK82381.1 8-oxo-dGTP diphosphatase MutT [Rheinheimera tangshanensis]GGM54402.1 7,8-dihydro-8-oxoguanine-triphosphatase [Rheinheimera tangshanensis]
MTVKVVHVAVGVVLQDHKVLLALRPDKLHQGGRWEFPGGKVEAGETTAQALARELQEEVDLAIAGSTAWFELQYAYPEKTVLLDIHLVQDFTGEAKGLEGQPVRWVPLSELHQYQFPDANQPILDKLLSEFGNPLRT